MMAIASNWASLLIPQPALMPFFFFNKKKVFGLAWLSLARNALDVWLNLSQNLFKHKSNLRL